MSEDDPTANDLGNLLASLGAEAAGSTGQAPRANAPDGQTDSSLKDALFYEPASFEERLRFLAQEIDVDADDLAKEVRSDTPSSRLIRFLMGEVWQEKPTRDAIAWTKVYALHRNGQSLVSAFSDVAGEIGVEKKNCQSVMVPIRKEADRCAQRSGLDLLPIASAFMS